MKPIPVAAARDIANRYGFDQVVIVARKVGEGGGEHCTTFGRGPEHGKVAARIGDFLTQKVMGWVAKNLTMHEDAFEGAVPQGDLTVVQAALLSNIRRHTSLHGYSPTIAELAAATGAHGNAVVDTLKILARKGWIRRTPRVARSITIIRSWQDGPGS